MAGEIVSEVTSRHVLCGSRAGVAQAPPNPSGRILPLLLLLLLLLLQLLIN